jgi:hypothetical protein
MINHSPKGGAGRGLNYKLNNHSPKGGAGGGFYVCYINLRYKVGHTANIAVCAWYIPDFQGEDVPFQ